MHIERGLGASLEEKEVGLSRIGFGVRGLDRSLVWLGRHEIELVARQCDDDVLVCLALEFFYPCFGFVER